MEKLTNKLDIFADSTIKNSILGKILYAISGSITVQKTTRDFLFKLLILTQYFILCSLPLPLFANDRSGIGIMILISLVILFANIVINNNLKLSFNILDLIVIIFYLGFIISTFNSFFFKASLIGLSKYSLLIASYFLFKVILHNTDHGQINKILIVQIGIVTLVAILGMYQYFTDVVQLATWEDSSFGDTHTRVYSTLGNPNLLAGYLLLYLPICICLSQKQYGNFIYNLIFIMSSLILLLCIIFTGSRGAYISLGIGGLLTSLVFFYNFMLKRQKYTSIIAIVSFLLIGIVLSLPIFQERLSTLFSIWDYSSNVFRLNVWTACTEILKDNFLFGIGPGNIAFEKAYGLYMKNGFYALGSYNIFLEIIIQGGTITFISFISIFLASFSKLHLLFWENHQKLALGIFISLIMILTHGLFDTIYFRPQIMLPFWFLLAYIAKLDTQTAKR